MWINWIKYIVNLEVHFVAYLYILDLISTSVSVKQTHMHFNSAYVNPYPANVENMASS